MSRLTPPGMRVDQMIRRVRSTRFLVHRPSPVGNLPEAEGHGSAFEPSPTLKCIGSQATKRIHTIQRLKPITSSCKVIPLMQGFRTSAPKKAFHGLTTVDSHSLPSLPASTILSNKLRVPLLPDNYTPDRSPSSSNILETIDEAIPKPEISVLACYPDYVFPMTVFEAADSRGLKVCSK